MYWRPLPVLAITIYLVNNIIHKRSEHIQSLLSDLTTNAQQSYSGIRVIKSFVQEEAMYGHFDKNSEAYKTQRDRTGQNGSHLFSFHDAYHWPEHLVHDYDRRYLRYQW